MPGTVRDDARICRGCWDQMSVPIPIRGPLAVPFRIFGITQSKMNPNICTICERAFRRVKKHRHISATASILFADIRGYTRLSERMDPIELSNVVSAFQDQCAQGIWAHDGIVNKQMGDGLMAIFNFRRVSLRSAIIFGSPRSFWSPAPNPAPLERRER